MPSHWIPRPALVAMSAVLLLGTASTQEDAVGKQLPDLKATTWVGGDAITLREGTLYAVLCWWPGCGPCVALFPRIAALQTAKPKIAWYGVSNTHRGVNQALQRVPDLQLPTAASADFFATLGSLGLTSYPAVIVHDASGRILALGDPRSWTAMYPREPGVDIAELDPMLLPLQRTLARVQGLAIKPIDPQLLAKEADLSKQLEMARKFEDAELEDATLTELANLGPFFTGYAAQRVDWLAKTDPTRAWQFGVGYLREHGYQVLVVRALQRSILDRARKPDELARYDELLALGPDYRELAMASLDAHARTGTSPAVYGLTLIERFGDDRSLMLELARRAGRDRLHSLAVQAAVAVTALDPKCFEAAQLAADGLFADKQYAAAIPVLEKALEMAPVEATRKDLEQKLAYSRLKAKQ